MVIVRFMILVLGTILPSITLATRLPPSGPSYNNGIHLAVAPKCGSYNGNASDINHGLPDLRTFKTVVAFGDSYTTDGKNDGSAPLPPVLTGTSPKAGGRTTNGLTWVECLAADSQAVIMDYAVGGAVVNVSLWPSKSTADDFVSQVGRFLGQGHDLDPATTLYTSFFGINDYSASKTDGADRLALAAQDYLDLVQKLRDGPTSARYWLALDDYGRGSQAASGDAFKQQVFAGLGKMGKHVPHENKLQYAFVDLKTLWDGVLGLSPGYEAFGYTSSGACALNSSTTVGACTDPDHTFYWIPGHPSKQTHRIMADYVEQVVRKC